MKAKTVKLLKNMKTNLYENRLDNGFLAVTAKS